jgi:glycosyltransferase involved in cell wall biosynthesis
MNVLFCIQGFEVAASRYRALQYLPYLNRAGIETEVIRFPGSIRGWLQVLPAVKKADILFIQRKRLPLSVLQALRVLGKSILYDFDDAVMFKNSLSPTPYSLRRRLAFRRMLRYTDLVIAGNTFLKEEAQRYHGDVRIIPTPIDADRYPPKVYYRTNHVNIGWIGDHGSIHYMESYKDIWEELGRRYRDLSLTIICDTFIDTRDISLIRRQWSSEREVEYLQELDIGVMPLFNDLWSQGKCGFKIIQYLAAGVPAVCTPVGINREVVEPGVTGFWAESRQEWVERLSALIDDPEMRQRMGTEGRQKVLEGYTVQACAPRLVNWLKELAEVKA